MTRSRAARKRHSLLWFLAFVAVAAVTGPVAVGPPAAAAGPSDSSGSPERRFVWDSGRLVARGRQLPAGVAEVVRFINSREFDKAIVKTAQIQGVGADGLRGELALAAAGHLENDKPKRALTAAGGYLRRAAAGETDITAMRLWHELELFHFVPQQGWRTDPQALPARDLIGAGKVDQGLARLSKSAHHWVSTWGVAGHFQGREIFDRLLTELVKKVRANTSGQQRANLERLIARVRKHRWARLMLPKDSLLYPRAMLEPLRSYYWWWKQMGERYRPMSKQGFHEILNAMKPLFPRNVYVRMYAGEDMPWGEGFRPDPPPPGAPAGRSTNGNCGPAWIMSWNGGSPTASGPTARSAAAGRMTARPCGCGR